MSKDFSVVTASSDSAQDSLVKKYKITIGGESYFLVSDEPEDRVRAVAALVDAQMRSIAHQGHSDDPKRVAVLVALQCASKMLAAHEVVAQHHVHITRLIDQLAQELVAEPIPENL